MMEQQPITTQGMELPSWVQWNVRVCHKTLSSFRVLAESSSNFYATECLFFQPTKRSRVLLPGFLQNS